MKIFYKREYNKLKKEFKEMVDIKNKAIIERDNHIKQLTNYNFDLMSDKNKLEKRKDMEEKNGMKLQIILDEKEEEINKLEDKYKKSYKESRSKTREIHKLEKTIEDYRTEGRYLIKKLPDDKTTSKQTMKAKNTLASSNIARKMKGE